MSLKEFYTEEVREFVDSITILINNREFSQAIDLINQRLGTIKKENKGAEYYFLKFELAGFLIDIGHDSRKEEPVLQGLEIILAEKDEAKKYIWIGSIEYNLGNAKDTLFKIQREKDHFAYIPQKINYLLEAKNHYWKAYKLEMGKELTPQLITNLANSLSSCGRIVESLQFYDLVLKKYPEFPQASASRSLELIWLRNISLHFTQNLIYKAKVGYDIASKAKDIPGWMIESWKNHSDYLAKVLKEIDFDESSVHVDQNEIKKERESHSEYRIFSIENYLTLSEHSLYCDCTGARQDDLMICIPYTPFTADYIPHMEKTLNRLKSEFSLARLFYFFSLYDSNNALRIYDTEVMYSELYDNEYLGTSSELLRTSFRLCFGILDKIAVAICRLYDLADEKEPIYFEKFWNPKNKKSKKQSVRWERINSIKNISLLALYTQATDLNYEQGEWSFFKSWRNSLEHGQLILVDDEEFDDKFGINDNPDLVLVPKKYFIEKTLMILQFTRSAIFNFVFMVRNEANNDKTEKEGFPIKHTFNFKNDHEE